MEFLQRLDGQLVRNPYYKEITGVTSALEVFIEYCHCIDDRVGTCQPQKSPKR